jgi:hypothetical protein
MAKTSLKALLNALNSETSCAQSVPFLVSVLQSSSFAEDASLLAKWHARLSALLQSKSDHARWTGVCLVKASVERPSGGWDTLISHGVSWTKLLLTLLEREKSQAIMERAICTLVSIFDLTGGKPALTREITTPSLPTFCQILCTILAKPHLAGLKKIVFYQLQRVLGAHPTTFRPFAGKLQAVSLAGISGAIADPDIIELSARCYASLHLCAPKNGAAEQWTVGFLASLGEGHMTLNYLLQHMVETKPNLPQPRGLEMLPFTADYLEGAPLALQRLQSLVQAIKAFLTLPSKEPVKIPVAHLVEFCRRILDITLRSGMRASAPQSTQLVLMTMLPSLHLCALDVLATGIDVLGNNLTPHIGQLYAGVMDAMNSPDLALQSAALNVHAQILKQYGPLEETSHLFQAVKLSLRVLSAIARPEALITSSQKVATKKRKHGNEGGDTVSNASAFHTIPPTSHLMAACACLSATLTATYGILAPAMRQQIERIVLQILLADDIELPEQVTLALLDVVKSAIQHPVPNAPSILAHAAGAAERLLRRSPPAVQEAAKALLAICQDIVHPRMPALRRRIAEADLEDDEDEEEHQEIQKQEDDAELEKAEQEPAFEQVHDAAPNEEEAPRKTAFELPSTMAPYEPIEPASTPIPAPVAVPPPTKTSEAMTNSFVKQLDSDDEDDDEMAEICTDSATDDEA